MAQSTKFNAGRGRFERVLKIQTFQRRKKSGFVTLPWIPFFHGVFLPLLGGD
jgi:hypothetical protein